MQVDTQLACAEPLPSTVKLCNSPCPSEESPSCSSPGPHFILRSWMTFVKPQPGFLTPLLDFLCQGLATAYSLCPLRNRIKTQCQSHPVFNVGSEQARVPRASLRTRFFIHRTASNTVVILLLLPRSCSQEEQLVPSQYKKLPTLMCQEQDSQVGDCYSLAVFNSWPVFVNCPYMNM